MVHPAISLIGLIDHRLPFGVIALGEGGTVLAMNHAAHEILHRADGLRVSKGRLTTAQRRETADLDRLVSEVAGYNGDHVAAQGGAMSVSRTSNRRNYGLLIAPLRPISFPPPEHIEPRAVVFVNDPERPARSWKALLHERYDLTGAEADVALLVLEGARPEDIAKRRRSTLNTARTQLKRVLDKVGARSQADLVRMLLSEPNAQEAEQGGNRDTAAK